MVKARTTVQDAGDAAARRVETMSAMFSRNRPPAKNAGLGGRFGFY
jgi:hypothetical protein